MSDYIFYFAYGSNMSSIRLKERISSAKFICVAKLLDHTLKFHKISKKDGSGKCDASYTGKSKDFILGAVYSVHKDQLNDLDRFEGCGSGYKRKLVSVIIESNKTMSAETYIATKIDKLLRPFDWYKEHVLRGAQAIGLSPEYISMINEVSADPDPNVERRMSELSIYENKS